VQARIDKKAIVAIIVLAVLVLALAVGAFVFLRGTELPRIDIGGIFTSDEEADGTEEAVIAESTEVEDIYVFVGIWAWDEDVAYEYHFFADGTGRRGWDDTIQTFTWSIGIAGGLVITLDEPVPGHPVVEVWGYVIAGDVLTLQFEDLKYSYIRVGAANEVETIGGSPELVGLWWAWNEGETFHYRFSADGTGSRGGARALLTFTWSTTNLGGLVVAFDVILEDYLNVMRWSYIIEDDTLTVTSRQFEGLEYSYIRVE